MCKHKMSKNIPNRFVHNVFVQIQLRFIDDTHFCRPLFCFNALHTAADIVCCTCAYISSILLSLLQRYSSNSSCINGPIADKYEHYIYCSKKSILTQILFAHPSQFCNSALSESVRIYYFRLILSYSFESSKHNWTQY